MQMIIASRVSDGRVVFLAEGARWVEAIGDGIIADSRERIAELLEIAQRSVRETEIVDPYAIDVTEDNGARRPAVLREAIRAFGPSTAD